MKNGGAFLRVGGFDERLDISKKKPDQRTGQYDVDLHVGKRMGGFFKQMVCNVSDDNWFAHAEDYERMLYHEDKHTWEDIQEQKLQLSEDTRMWHRRHLAQNFNRGTEREAHAYQWSKARWGGLMNADPSVKRKKMEKMKSYESGNSTATDV